MLDRWPQVLHHLDQPHGDASFMPTLRVSELAAQHVKVVLTGDGGDELFAGYEKYARLLRRGPASQASCRSAFHRRYFDAISLFSPARQAALYQPGSRERSWAASTASPPRPGPGSRKPRTSTASTRRCTSTCSCCCRATTWSSRTAWAWRCRSRRARPSSTGG